MNLKQILKDVRHVVHLPVHEMLASCSQLVSERFERRVNGLQRSDELGQISNFKARVDNSMK